MAEPYQPVNINTGSAQQAIQATPVITPNLQNLVQGVTSGMISIADLQKRGMDLPLESAQRTQDLADVSQLRPLQREAATAQLQNIQAKQQFEAESLPILNDTKREALQQEYQNVLQHGVPASTLKLFNQIVPGFMPYDKAKLFPKEGGVDTSYALEVIGKAMDKAQALAERKRQQGIPPTETKNTDASGREVTTRQVIDPLTGQPVGPPYGTGVKEPNATEAAQKAAQASEGIRKEFHANDTIQAFNKVDAAVHKIRLAAVPNSTPFQDMSSIFSLMKLLDPGSTVREGEYATVEKSRGWPDAFRGFYNKALSGQKLTDTQKQQLLQSGEQNYQGQLQNALPAIRQFVDLEDQNGLAPGTVVPVEFRERLKTTPTGTTATTTVTATAPAAAGSIPSVQTVDEARALPPTVQYFRVAKTGQMKLNPNYRP